MKQYRYFVVFHLVMPDGKSGFSNIEATVSQPILNHAMVVDLQTQLMGQFGAMGVTIINWQPFEEPQVLTARAASPLMKAC